jgi:DNA ligase-4
LSRFHSFLKVGGGFTAGDYAKIRFEYLLTLSDTSRHITDGHWNDWDPNNPPMEYIELADANQTFERPDQWIKPDE